MIADDIIKISGFKDLPMTALKSLLYFYGPLIKEDGVLLYEYLLISSRSSKKIELVLSDLNFSLDRFITSLNLCNEFQLVKTYKHQKEKIFLLEVMPLLSINDFCGNQIYLRLLEKAIGKDELNRRLQNNLTFIDRTAYIDISKTLSLALYDEWQNKAIIDKPIKINKLETSFKLDSFLKNISIILFPLNDRNEKNIETIISCANIYQIDEERMRLLLAKMYNYCSEFNSDFLYKLASQGKIAYRKLKADEYDVSPALFLMNKQQGHELTPNDQKMIKTLVEDYHLSKSVVNVLFEHCLFVCDNRLIGSYIYALASDLNRNSIESANEAKKFLNKEKKPKSSNIKKSNYKDVLPVYDDSKNPKLSLEEEARLEERVKSLLEGGKYE